jgi:hypothetical protein
MKHLHPQTKLIGFLAAACLALACLALSPQAQAGESTFSCRKLESDVALQLKVTNNGPDAVKNGTVVHYFYVTPTTPKGHTETGSYTLDHKVKKGETFVITINANWRARLFSCGVCSGAGCD